MSPHRDARLYTAKLSLRLASIILSILAAAMLGSAVPLQEYYSTDGLGGAIDGIALAAPCFCFVWSPISLILLACLRRRRRSYNPIADIVMDFLCFGLAVGMASMVLVWNVYIGGVESYETRYTGFGPGNRAAAVNGFEAAGGSFCVLLAAVHLPLFIIACYETDVWRKTEKHGKAGVEVGKGGTGTVEIELEHHEPGRH